MMSKTHLSVGIAAALAVAPATSEGLFYALLGGSIGSMICDIDRSSEGTVRDAGVGWLITAVVSIAAWMKKSIFSGVGFTYRDLVSDPWKLICLAFLIGMYLFAISGAHRGFSHSLLMLVCSFFFIFFISRRMSLFYGIAFLTHIILDVLNKRPVKVLYPMKKGFCLYWFYCDGTTNNILMLAGTAAVIALLFFKFGISLVNFV